MEFRIDLSSLSVGLSTSFLYRACRRVAPPRGLGRDRSTAGRFRGLPRRAQILHVEARARPQAVQEVRQEVPVGGSWGQAAQAQQRGQIGRQSEIGGEGGVEAGEQRFHRRHSWKEEASREEHRC